MRDLARSAIITHENKRSVPTAYFVYAIAVSFWSFKMDRNVKSFKKNVLLTKKYMCTKFEHIKANCSHFRCEVERKEGFGR